MTRQAIATTFARSRGGRALLHAMCMARGRNMGWHVRGIVRELFGNDARTGGTARLCGGTSSHRRPSNGSFGLFVLTLSFVVRSLAQPAGAAEGETNHFTLLPVAQVDSSGIFLHQISTATGVDPSTLQVPVRLMAAPAFGRSALVTRDQIVAALQTARPDLAANRWSGADAIRVTRRARLLAESELRELLTAALQNDVVKERGALELRLARPWPSVQVPEEPLALKILDVPTSGVSQHFIVRFELAAGEDRLGPWQAVTQGRILKNVLIAGTTIRRGQILESSDVTVERRDMLTLRDPLEEAALHNGPFEFIETVAAGQPILARSVRPRPVVQRGMLVDGLVRDGSLQITLKVEIMADALPGQMVRVRNPKTKREFYAKVKDEQTVLINL
jgi:flagella basal body P-ring formation protein FlgA